MMNVSHDIGTGFKGSRKKNNFVLPRVYTGLGEGPMNERDELI
jgi:hypothetical protein